jgi:hypothetical protein
MLQVLGAMYRITGGEAGNYRATRISDEAFAGSFAATLELETEQSTGWGCGSSIGRWRRRSGRSLMSLRRTQRLNVKHGRRSGSVRC